MKFNNYLFVMMLLCALNSQAQLKIGKNLESIHKTSVLEIETDSGTFVFPRLSTSERDALGEPLIGATLYNTTDNNLQVFTNNGWQSSNSGGKGNQGDTG